MVKLDISGIPKKLEDYTDKARYAIANQVLVDSNLFAPKRTGVLRASSYITSDNKEIIWNTPYAGRLYYVQFQNYTTGGTGSLWFETAKQRFAGQWAEVGARAIK